MQSDKTKLFITKAVAKHGDRYDYSLVEYVRSRDKVTIVCGVHGVFEQRVDDHLQGRGCNKCGGSNPLSLDEFIRKANIKHGDRYDYSSSIYINHDSKIKINCIQHGMFEQTANDHLNGQGCATCGGRPRINKASFISKARLIHGDVYNYSAVRYVNQKTKVVIRCDTHGEFKQSAGNHLTGSGCPECGDRFDRNQTTRIYLLTNGQNVKIGISIDVERRMMQQARSQPFESELVKTWTIPSFQAAFDIEQKAHDALNSFNALYEGFDGASEWFTCPLSHAEEIVNTLVGASGI